MSLTPQNYGYKITTNFNKHYAIYSIVQSTKLRYIESYITFVNDPDLWTQLQGFFKDLPDWLLSCYIYPFSPLVFTNAPSVYVKLANVEFGTQFAVDRQVRGYLIGETDKLVSMGSVYINRISNDFMDFTEDIEIYLPFANTIRVDAKDVMNHILDFQLSVDFNTGMCTYYVNRQAYDGERYGIRELYMTITGKIGFEMPIGKTNAQEVTRNVITSAIQIVGGIVVSVATGGVGTAIGATAIVKGASTLVNSQLQVSKGSTQGGNDKLNCPNSIIVYRRRQKVINKPSDYVHFKGRPLREKRLLENLRGFTKCNDVHIENFGSATEQEKRHIEFLLKNGVIL